MRSLTRFVRRLRYGAPIVVVSGLPRSGTSMAMRMLEAGGMPPASNSFIIIDVPERGRPETTVTNSRDTRGW